MASRRAEARTRYYCREEAKRLGWEPRHPWNGGQFLEEQEVVDYFPRLASVLGGRRPDFLVLSRDEPAMVIETESHFGGLARGSRETQAYADLINSISPVKVAVAVCGTPDTAI